MEIKKNNLADKEGKVACGVCKSETAHLVLVNADASGTSNRGWNDELHWSESYQVVQCMGCKNISFCKIYSDSDTGYYQVAPDEWEHERHVQVFPNPTEGRVEISDSVLLPDNVSRIYKETIKTLNQSQPVLCGIGIRALLEAVVKEKKATGKDLYHKIDNLVGQGVLTKEGASILHKLRSMGNDAAHEVKPHAAVQLSLAMDVVEHLLQGVYILPHHAKSTFK